MNDKEYSGEFKVSQVIIINAYQKDIYGLFTPGDQALMSLYFLVKVLHFKEWNV